MAHPGPARRENEDELTLAVFAEKHSASIALVDPDRRRRADVCHKLQPFKLSVEPFDCLEEIRPGSAYDALLAADVEPGVPELIDAMAQRGYRWPVVAFRNDVNVSRIVAAIRSGAANYLQWPCDPAVIAEALAGLKRQAVVHDRKSREGVAKGLTKLLTTREKTILQAITHGLTSKMIGERLSISTRTVEAHRRNLMRKLGARNMAQSVRISLEAD